MLDILNAQGKVVAVLLDDGTVVKRENLTDDMEKLVKDKLESLKRDKQE